MSIFSLQNFNMILKNILKNNIYRLLKKKYKKTQLHRMTPQSQSTLISNPHRLQKSHVDRLKTN